jgi:hypothetical protein
MMLRKILTLMAPSFYFALNTLFHGDSEFRAKTALLRHGFTLLEMP